MISRRAEGSGGSGEKERTGFCQSTARSREESLRRVAKEEMRDFADDWTKFHRRYDKRTIRTGDQIEN